MSPGIGLMKRRIEDEKSAISFAISCVSKKYKLDPKIPKILETKYHSDAGDWYVALGWEEKRVIVQMDSVLGSMTEIKEI
ncbi:MAG: hypothetical protein K8823_1267 [Cenarchaeum symbiont of Oopsacas minuta]|nr:hypothetical protein [Cenarchaeum symbiont of Oopsacas minuta]